MDWEKWVSLMLATAIGAGTVIEVHHVGQVIQPHVEPNLPPQPPRFTQAVAPTGSGPLLDNAYSTVTASGYVAFIPDEVFIIRL
jgi:hypothetical protein